MITIISAAAAAVDDASDDTAFGYILQVLAIKEFWLECDLTPWPCRNEPDRVNSGFICVLFNDVFSSSVYVVRNDWMVVNNKLK